MATTNQRLSRRLPVLGKRRQALARKLEATKAEASCLMLDWSDSAPVEARAFVNDQLSGLAKRRDGLERGLAQLEADMAVVRGCTVTSEVVRAALARIDQVYGCLRPHERKELFRLLVRSVVVADREITLEIYPVTGSELLAPTTSQNGASRSKPAIRGAALVPESVKRPPASCEIPSRC